MDKQLKSYDDHGEPSREQETKQSKIKSLFDNEDSYNFNYNEKGKERSLTKKTKIKSLFDHDDKYDNFLPKKQWKELNKLD